MKNPQSQPGGSTWLTHVIGGVLCAGLLGLGWFMGLGPLTSEASIEHEAIDQADQVEDQARLTKLSLEALAVELSAAQEQIRQQPIDLAPAGQINALLSYLAQASSDQGMEITTMKVESTESLEYFDYVPVLIGGEGDYMGLLSLIGRIHSERADLGLVGFDMKRQSVVGRVLFNLRLAWFVEQSHDQPAAATAAAPTP